MQALELDFDTTAAMMGMPYQFLPWVDRRAKGGDDVISNFKYLGRKYAEKIAVRSPMLIIQPGKAHYMAESSNEEKEALLSGMLGDDAAISNSSIDEETANPHRYYSFAFNYAEYYKFVNAMCRSTAAFLGIDDLKITVGDYSAKLGNFQWERSIGNDFGSYLSSITNSNLSLLSLYFI